MKNKMIYADQIVLGIFFLYFVLIGGQCGDLMSCQLQRYVSANIWVKHIMIFLTIYVFTFVLGWYTVKSLVVEGMDVKEEDSEQEKQFEGPNKLTRNNQYVLLYYFLYSIIIYLIFIISTKNEGPYLMTYLLLTLVLTFLYVYTKSINEDIQNKLKGRYWIGRAEYDKTITSFEDDELQKKDFHQIVIIMYVITIGYILSLGILFIGIIRYYMRQSREHADNWSWITFFFGSNKCRSIDNVYKNTQ